MANKASKKVSGLWNDFKKFVSRGNVVDMAVGVIIGGAFSAIINAFVNILLSVCTWAVPGGLKGLVTVLPALNPVQKGLEGIGQSFSGDVFNDMVEVYKGLYPLDGNPVNGLKSMYTLYGTNWYYNWSSIINWGTLINAVISFFIIAIVLFIVVKSVAYFTAKKKEVEEAIREQYYKKHPEARPAPVVPGVPVPSQTELLIQIRDLLDKQAKEK